jgi:hypothetical protein
MAEVWLLCEGDSDVPVLAPILTTVLAAEIIPKPVGGSSNAASAAEYVSRHQPSVTVAYVVDRDYRQKHVADATYTDGKRKFMWRRHAIESYLLAPAVIVQAFKRLQASVAGNPGGPPAWVASLPLDEAVVADGLRACAAARAPEEALRIAVERLWEDLSDTAGRIQKRTPSIPGSSAPDAAACRQALLDEAERIAQKAQETTATPHLTAAQVGARYDAQIARVTDAAYVRDMEFLEEFHGKDLLGALYTWLVQQYGFRQRKESFITELVDAVPIAYQANRRLYGTDDFLDLANGVRALAGLAPIA